VEIDFSDASISDDVIVCGSVPSLKDFYMVSKSPRSAPSRHRTRLLILDAGTREPRTQRLVALSIIICIYNSSYNRVGLFPLCC
jgi:hypothetical protein